MKKPTLGKPASRPRTIEPVEDQPGGQGLPILLAIIVIGVIIWMVMKSDHNYIKECKPDHYVSHTTLAVDLVEVTCMNRHGRERTIIIETD